MHVKRLAPGVRAPDGWDFIEIEQTPSGRFQVIGAVIFDKSAMFGQETFATAQEAEQAGISWAQGLGSQILYLATVDGDTPLRNEPSN